MNDDRIKLVHAAVVAMITSPEFVDGLVRKILAVVPAQQADNSAMAKPCPHYIRYKQCIWGLRGSCGDYPCRERPELRQ